MDWKDASLQIADKIRYAKSFLNIVSIAAENTEYFPTEGQDIAIIMELVMSELSGCCNALEAALDGHGHSGGVPHP